MEAMERSELSNSDPAVCRAGLSSIDDFRLSSQSRCEARYVYLKRVFAFFPPFGISY
jgi:hypothetical protein